MTEIVHPLEIQRECATECSEPLNHTITCQNVSLHRNAYYPSYRNEDVSSALELREANGIAEIPGFSERRAPAVVELIPAWKALQDRKAVHEESGYLARTRDIL